ncbi:hypothetical protein VTO73DRAFT_4474 [Trametes versicolor]
MLWVSPEYEDGYDYSTLTDEHDYVFDVPAASIQEHLTLQAQEVVHAAPSRKSVLPRGGLARILLRDAGKNFGLLHIIEQEEGEHHTAIAGMLWYCLAKSMYLGTANYFRDSQDRPRTWVKHLCGGVAQQ